MMDTMLQIISILILITIAAILLLVFTAIAWWVIFIILPIALIIGIVRTIRKDL